MGFLEVAHGLKDGISLVGVTKMRRSVQSRYCNVSLVNEIKINSKNLLSAHSFFNFLSPMG